MLFKLSAAGKSLREIATVTEKEFLNLRIEFPVAYNVSGLSAVLIFRVTSSPVTKDKKKCWCWINFIDVAKKSRTMMQPISERDDQYIFFSQHSSKPNVSGSCLVSRINDEDILFLFALKVPINFPRKGKTQKK
jgi:hypothetical protein